MMKKSLLKLSSLAILTIMCSQTSAQTIADYVRKNDAEKIQKGLKMFPGSYPITAAGFGDGHGRTVLMTSVDQIPKKVALITFYIYDLGTQTSSKTSNAYTGITHYSTSYTWLSDKGGNLLANEALKVALPAMKQAYNETGAELLLPEEFLNTAQKREFYYNTFSPNISKIGKLLNNIEVRRVDMSITADYFRGLDQAAASDHLRAESLAELAKALEVDAVLSIAIELKSDGSNVYMHGTKVSLNGPNTIPKQDKKYVGQNLGTGYYSGQVYVEVDFWFDKPVKVASYKKKNLEGMNFEGLGEVYKAIIKQFDFKMRESIAVAAKKYGK